MQKKALKNFQYLLIKPFTVLGYRQFYQLFFAIIQLKEVFKKFNHFVK